MRHPQRRADQTGRSSITARAGHAAQRRLSAPFRGGKRQPVQRREVEGLALYFRDGEFDGGDIVRPEVVYGRVASVDERPSCPQAIVFMDGQFWRGVGA